ncbi:hypothetical protein [Variovorax sp.]|jgi:hypothetical protein|uniref:hypothetical protein n=1 Tax=Variovorax sp. TaxID=1871043 RepID=UPI001AD4C00A|nr:hypothetical protein [Burkholderiales bacterium]
MPHRHAGRAAHPEELSLLKVLAELGCVVVLLLCVKAVERVESVVAPQAPHTPARATTAAARRQIPSPPPLQWRGPWWAWQLLVWAIATITAPTVLIVGSALLINAQSDHPLFWWSLPAIVAIGNAAAILTINQQHHREPFTDRQALARRHVVISAVTGATLSLLVGTVSGFLSDVIAPLSNAANVAFPALASTLCSAGLAIIFALLSFAHAGAVHAALGFKIASARSRLSIAA